MSDSEDRDVWQLAFEILDKTQDLVIRGVTIGLFRKIYTNEECQRILAKETKEDDNDNVG